MLVPDAARAFGCPYGVDDEVDMLATGPDWNAVEQTGDGWVPARIAAADKSCRYDVAAYVGGVPETFNPLHDQLRPAQLPRLTSEEIVNQGNAAVAATTCAPGGSVDAYTAQDLGGMTQRGAIAEILKSFAGASVYLDPPIIGVPAKVTPGSIYEARYPMAMPETEVYPVKMGALICTPASPRKSEQRWAYNFVCYTDRFDTFVCKSEGGVPVN